MPLDASGLLFPRATGSPEELRLDVRPSLIHGRPVLHFPYMFMSDWHLNSRFAKATMLRMTLRDFEQDRLTVGGDGEGGIEREHKKTDKCPEGHTQARAQVLQKADASTEVVYLEGNHEEGMGRFLRQPQRVFGIEFRQTSEYRASPTRLMFEEHGHAHDLQLFGTAENQKRGYRFGTALLYLGSEIDCFMHHWERLEEWSIVNWGKRHWKEYANKQLGLLQIIGDDIDGQGRYAGSISGHSHILGFNRTAGGKLLCNAGSSTTKGSEFIAYDGRNFAAVERLRDRMNIEMESGHKYTVYFKDIGLDHFRDPPALMDNVYVDRAEQLQGFAYALWPAKDQQEIRRQLEERRCAVDRLLCILSDGQGLPNFGEAQRALFKAASEVADLREQRGVNPYPPIRGYKLGLEKPVRAFEPQLQGS